MKAFVLCAAPTAFCLLAFATSHAAEAPRPDMAGLALLLHLDEARPEVRDTGGEDYAVAVHGAGLGVAGRIGQAARFDGEDDHVVVDSTLCLAQQTILLWVRPAAGRAAGGILSSQQKPGRSSWRWRISRNADRTVSFHLYDNSLNPEPDREARSRSVLPDGVWSHIAVTVDTRDAHAAALYLNGSRVGEARVEENSPHGSLFVGTATNEGYFAGDIDEVAVFERVLSPEQIACLAASRVPLPDGSLIASESIVLRPVGDAAWFTFKHPKLGRRRWMLRVPEHMYYDDQQKRSRVPYGVRWEVLDDRGRLKFRCGLSDERKRELCLDFWGEVRANRDTIDYELRVKNVGDKAWTRMPMSLFCLQCGKADGFRDYEAKRTFVRKAGSWTTMNTVVAGKFAPHRMCGVSVRQGDKPGYERLAARVSEDGRYVIGIATDCASSLSFNFHNRIACMHSNPNWGLLKPGEQATAKGRVYLFEGTLDDLWKRYCTDFGVAQR